MKLGRPTIKTPELTDELFSRMAEGESLRAICKADNMPSPGTIMRWCTEDPIFKEQYARALQVRALLYAEDLVDTSEQASQVVLVDGVPLMHEGKPITTVDAASVNHARLKTDTKKWVVSKLLPKVYGELVKMEVSGPDSGPIQITDKASAMADILAKAAERKAAEDKDLEGLV